jgi:hypothetical protein
MLASLLPGLRDLRTPLATGYLWVIVLWLLLHDRLPKSIDAATGPVKSLYELGGLLGRSALLAALSFVAYLLGSMLLLNLRTNFSKFRAIPARFSLGQSGRLLKHFFTFALMVVNRGQIPSIFRQLTTFLETRLRETAQHLDDKDHRSVLGYSDRPLPDYRGDFRDALPSFYAGRIVEDLPTVGIQLQPKNRDFWDTYDRQNAEAQFRFGVAPPITLIIIIVAWQSQNLWWLFLLVAPIYLLILGVGHSARATSTLVQAVVLKMVEPPVLERLREQIAKRQELDQQRQEAMEKRQREKEEARQDRLRETEAGRELLEAERRLEEAERGLEEADWELRPRRETL